MGMYTTFIFNGTIKKQYYELIESIVNCNKEWIECESEYPWLKQFTKLSRSSFIPYGSMTAYNEDKFSPSTFCEFKYGTLSFCCDLKNYSKEIETFMSVVASEICERINFAASWYEEDLTPTIYYPPHP